jgi:hypothetical protein
MKLPVGLEKYNWHKWHSIFRENPHLLFTSKTDWYLSSSICFSFYKTSFLLIFFFFKINESQTSACLKIPNHDESTKNKGSHSETCKSFLQKASSDEDEPTFANRTNLAAINPD